MGRGAHKAGMDSEASAESEVLHGEWSRKLWCYAAVQAFYDEKKNVDFDNPEYNKKKGKVAVNGHFLAMIDKTMGRMGVGCAPDHKV